MGELTSLSITDSKEALESSFRREEWLVIVLSSSLVLSLVSDEAACRRFPSLKNSRLTGPKSRLVLRNTLSQLPFISSNTSSSSSSSTSSSSLVVSMFLVKDCALLLLGSIASDPMLSSI